MCYGVPYEKVTDQHGQVPVGRSIAAFQALEDVEPTAYSVPSIHRNPSTSLRLDPDALSRAHNAGRVRQ